MYARVRAKAALFSWVLQSLYLHYNHWRRNGLTGLLCILYPQFDYFKSVLNGLFICISVCFNAIQFWYGYHINIIAWVPLDV